MIQWAHSHVEHLKEPVRVSPCQYQTCNIIRPRVFILGPPRALLCVQIYRFDLVPDTFKRTGVKDSLSIVGATLDPFRFWRICILQVALSVILN